jgi:hypothetical protein
MDDEEFQALQDSIESIGVQNPIVIFDEMVIDGWHRYRAANLLGYQCPEVDLPADTDPKDFVLAQNNSRRSLTAAQRAAATIRVHAWVAGDGAATVAGAKTNAELATLADVSERTIRSAKAVETKAVPEVKEAVEKGDLPLARAAKIAQLPPEEQVDAIATPVPRPYLNPSAVKVTLGNENLAELDAMRERLDELSENLKHALEDNASMARVFEANDQVAAALKEAERYREECRVLNDRIRGLMNEKNAAVKAATSAKKQIAKLEKDRA